MERGGADHLAAHTPLRQDCGPMDARPDHEERRSKTWGLEHLAERLARARPDRRALGARLR